MIFDILDAAMKLSAGEICRKLGIGDFHYVEIESKRRVVPEEQKSLKAYLQTLKNVKHLKMAVFFDQFLDTPSMELLRAGVSLRLRYKKDGSRVYMQYKGPGFHKEGLLFRSEFSSGRLRQLLMEESHHDIVHFTETSVQDIFAHHIDVDMRSAMIKHLGEKVLSRITSGPIISIYHKDKFMVDLGAAFLEPSLDRVFAFHINKKGLHPLSTFCEYENEIKTDWRRANAKIDRLPALLEFDARLARRFDMRPEKLDKYHRCASFFV